MVALLVLAAAAGQGAEFTVSPTGSDTNAGTAAQPFRTIGRAMKAVRELRSGQPTVGPITVYLRGGRHTLSDHLTFRPHDTGTVDSPITYTSAPGERACISGGRRITGPWVKSPGKPYFETTVPAAKNGDWTFNSLYVNGGSRMRARTPNWGDKVLRAAGPAVGEDEREAFAYRPGDIDPSWTNVTDIDIVLLQSWTPTIHRIEEVLADRRVVRFDSSHQRSVDFWERNFRYYPSNVLEGLDEPGEWYLNEKTGKLYYYPAETENMAEAEVIAPVVKSRLVEFQGDVEGGKFIEHLRFANLDFRHVDGDMDKYNGVYRQGHMFLDAAIHAEGLRSSLFHNCEIAQVGEYALEMGPGCRENRIEHCHIWDIGAGAMQLGITSLGTLLDWREKTGSKNKPSPADVVSITVDNNCIHRLGTIWHGCYGIVNRFASLTRITHNDIFDTHWDPIGLDARWNWDGEEYSHGNVIAYNHLHHYGLRYHTDCGAIYQFGPLDTHIHHNLIHDGRPYPYICGAAGVYLDQQSRNALVENNIVYNVEWYAYFQHTGTDNVFRNNIGAFARDGLIRRAGLSGEGDNYMEAYGNIYIADDNVALGDAWRPGKRPPVLRDNMYHTIAPDTDFTFAGKSFTEWQSEGHDAGSVIGDPGCADPAHYDFSLEPNAPAVKAIGFEPFDAEIAKAGLYGDSQWRSLPERQRRRKPTAVWTPVDLAKLISFDMDFEDMPVGYKPSVFRLAGAEGAATFAVSDDAARGGEKSYRCVDKEGLEKPFYPYIHLAPRKLEEGEITFSFDAMQAPDNPAAFSVECRGKGSTREIGPSLRFEREGQITAGDTKLLDVEPGSWFHVEIAFELGPNSPKEYSVVARRGEIEKKCTLPFKHDAFSDLRWLGITAFENANGVFYLDNMKLKVE